MSVTEIINRVKTKSHALVRCAGGLGDVPYGVRYYKNGQAISLIVGPWPAKKLLRVGCTPERLVHVRRVTEAEVQMMHNNGGRLALIWDSVQDCLETEREFLGERSYSALVKALISSDNCQPQETAGTA